MALGLGGSKCRRCGKRSAAAGDVRKPVSGAIKEMDSYRFSHRRGTLFTYTGDLLAFSLSPPLSTASSTSKAAAGGCSI